MYEYVKRELSEPLITLIVVMGWDAPALLSPSHPLPGPLPSRERGYRGAKSGAGSGVDPLGFACSRPLTLREGGVGLEWGDNVGSDLVTGGFEYVRDDGSDWVGWAG